MPEVEETITVRQIKQAGTNLFKASSGISLEELRTQRNTGDSAVIVFSCICIRRQSNLKPDIEIYTGNGCRCLVKDTLAA
jgi:hypothetical protein